MSEVAITVPQARPNASVVTAGCLPPEVNIHALMEYRRGQVRRREYKPLGILEKLFIDPAGIANMNGRTNLLAARRGAAMIEWRGLGPLVGMTEDAHGNFLDTLICSAMQHPPDLPEDGWKPNPRAPLRYVNGIPTGPDVPMEPQRLRDRAAGILPAAKDKWFRWARGKAAKAEDDFYFVIGPLTQVVLLATDQSGVMDLHCSADGNGRHTMLLYNPHREEGHILFGQIDCQTFAA